MQEEEIEKIQIREIRKIRSPGLVINNLYTLLTIIIMSVVILWYVNYVLPEQKAQSLREEHKKAYLNKLQEQKEQREAQIELSKRLNSRDNDVSK